MRLTPGVTEAICTVTFPELAGVLRLEDTVLSLPYIVPDELASVRLAIGITLFVALLLTCLFIIVPAVDPYVITPTRDYSAIGYHLV